MRSKLGEDEKVLRIVKRHLKRALKNKYFKLGYKAASKHKGRNENPYKLTEKMLEIMRKRTYWDLGWEQKAYSPSKDLRKGIKKHKKRESKHHD